MVVILYLWWAKGEKDQLGKPVVRGSRTQGTSGTDSGDRGRASARPTGSDDHRHYAYLGFWAAGMDCGRPIGAAPDSQLHGQQLAQRAGGAIGVSGGGAIGVSGGGGLRVSGAGTGIGA